MKTLIFLSILAISSLKGDESSSLLIPTDRWLRITSGEATTTQLLIQHNTVSGGLNRLTSQKTESFASYEGFKMTSATAVLSLINLVRQPIDSSDNPIWPEALKFQLKAKVGTVEKFSIDVILGNPKEITLSTILQLFPDTMGSIISIPDMTGLMVETGESPPTTTIIPVNTGVAVLDSISPYPTQRIRYHVTLGEGENARTEVYTQHGTKVSAPEITMTQWVEDYSDWWEWYREEGGYEPPPTQYYYEIRVTYPPGVDVTLESSDDTSLWNLAGYRPWNAGTTSMEAWFNVTNQPRLFFRAHAK